MLCFSLLLIIFLVIGLTLYLSGCDDNIGGYCNGFNIVNAKIIRNTCITKHGRIHHSHSRSAGDDDDGDYQNCDVIVQYIENNVNITCSVYRSDMDFCGQVIDSQQLRRCTRINEAGYEEGTYRKIYIKDGVCESHHYVGRIAIIGFCFLMIFVFFFLLCCCCIVYKNYENYKNYYERPSVPVIELSVV